MAGFSSPLNECSCRAIKCAFGESEPLNPPCTHSQNSCQDSVRGFSAEHCLGASLSLRTNPLSRPDDLSRLQDLFDPQTGVGDAPAPKLTPGVVHERHLLKESPMSLRIGDAAPNFQQESTEGRLDFHEWMGTSWAVLFSHPKDFTPVCTTELGTVSRLKPEFDKRGVKVMGLSVDPLSDHTEWAKDIEETQGAKLNFPLLADADRKVAGLYDMIAPNWSDTLTVRSVFIIDPKKKVRLILTYPASTGRNFTEILRVIDSLQLTDNHKVATPADWKDGQDVIIVPSLQDETEMKRLFPKGYKVIKPYLRVTPQPNK